MLGPIFQCSSCHTVFMQPRRVKHSRTLSSNFCPRCGAPEIEFDHVMDNSIRVAFSGIVKDNFTEVRRMSLRVISEAMMGPYNPLSREL